jgi:hypothetical protein
MPRKRFKIYPAPEEKPILDPSTAPWSSPRGFATSIPEEVAEWKRLVRAQNPPSKPLHVRKQKPPKQKSSFSFKDFLKKPFVATYNYFQTLTFSEERHEDINIRAHRYIGYLCCIRADVNSALQH